MSVKTSSLWIATSPDRPGGHLSDKLECDICVVGGGIAGLTTAFLLACEGRSVIVLESRPHVGEGETGVTTAHLASILDDRFSTLKSERGIDVVRLAYEAHSTAIDTIEAIAKAERIACDFVRVDGYLFPGTTDSAKTIDEEEATAREAGVAVERIDEVPLPLFRVGPCLRFARQGQFHPLKYLVGLANAFTRRGGQIACGCHVEKVEGGSLCSVTLRDGRVVQSRAVVLATNAPIQSGVRVNSRIAPYTTYAFAAEVPTGLVPRGLFWDTEDPYHYVRLHDEPGQRGVEDIIVGGEDHKTGQAEDQVDRWTRLEDWIRVRLPEMGAIKHRWSGQVFETLDGLALIGPDPGNDENIYIATGDSGMGMTHGTIAGLLLRDLILGRPNVWTELFDPKRMPIKSTETVLAEGTNMAAQYKDWFTPGEISKPEDVGPGRGAVMRRGLTKVAVHRDEEGTLHEMSAICPHMGCVVHWNDGESTWDCPCHGSRFTAEGHCLHGPATDDLTSQAKPQEAAR